jgi:hypothetical protein
MASETSESSQVDYVSDAVEEKLKESTDTSTHTEEPPKPSSKPRLFNRERSVHQLFGGGKGVLSLSLSLSLPFCFLSYV